MVQSLIVFSFITTRNLLLSRLKVCSSVAPFFLVFFIWLVGWFLLQKSLLLLNREWQHPPAWPQDHKTGGEVVVATIWNGGFCTTVPLLSSYVNRLDILSSSEVPWAQPPIFCPDICAKSESNPKCLRKSLAPSGSLRLSQALSGSLFLSEFAYKALAWLTRPLLGSQGPCLARSVATALQHFIQPWR